MKRTATALLLTAALFLLAGSTTAGAVELEDYTGTWTAEGITPDEENFTSTYEIEKTDSGLHLKMTTVADGKTYTSEGTIEKVGSSYKMVGTYQKDNKIVTSLVEDGRPGLYFVGTRSKGDWSTPWRTYFSPVEDGSFRIKVELVRDGGWQNFFVAEYTPEQTAMDSGQSGSTESESGSTDSDSKTETSGNSG